VHLLNRAEANIFSEKLFERCLTQSRKAIHFREFAILEKKPAIPLKKGSLKINPGKTLSTGIRNLIIWNAKATQASIAFHKLNKIESTVFNMLIVSDLHTTGINPVEVLHSFSFILPFGSERKE